MAFVSLPPANRGGEDRLAHLRGACRPHGPPGTVERETPFLPGQLAVLQEPAYLRFLILDQRLVRDVEEPPPKDGPPVPHHSVVKPVIATEFAQIVRKSYPVLGEIDLVARKARIHRVACAVNDFRVWKGEVNESDMEEVVRQLVRKPWRDGRAPPHRGDIGIAESAEIFAVEFLYRIGIAGAIAGALLESVDECREIAKLSAAMDLGMTGEDLLDQRGAARPARCPSAACRGRIWASAACRGRIWARRRPSPRRRRGPETGDRTPTLFSRPSIRARGRRIRKTPALAGCPARGTRTSGRSRRGPHRRLRARNRARSPDGCPRPGRRGARAWRRYRPPSAPGS